MSVYFAQVGATEAVKIGWATNVGRRLACLQAGQIEPFIVIRVIEGGRIEEAWLHRHFAGLHICREFFRFAPEMLTVEPTLADLPSHMASVVNLIDRWGSIQDFAADIGVSPNTAVAMRRRASIKWTHWEPIIAAAARRGFDDVTLELLCNLAADRRFGTNRTAALQERANPQYIEAARLHFGSAA